MDEPTILHAIARDLADLERHPEARAPLSPHRAAELYPLLSDARVSIGRLVDALNDESRD